MHNSKHISQHTQKLTVIHENWPFCKNAEKTSKSYISFHLYQMLIYVYVYFIVDNVGAHIIV